MTTYSAWIQPPDFTKTVTGYGAFAASGTSTLIENVYTCVHTDLEGEYRTTALRERINGILDAATSADPAYNTSQRSWPNLGGAVVKVGFSAPAGFPDKITGQPSPPFIEDEWAEVNHVPQVFSAYDVNGWFPPPMPPDAVGVEIEGQPAGTSAVRADIAQATLAATAYHSNVDATAEVQTEAAVTWTTAWMVGSGIFNGSRLAYYDGLHDRMGPTILTLQGNMEHGSTEDVTVDVTEHVSAMGELVLTNQVWASSIGLADLSYADEAGFGTTLTSPTITYTFRPPRYRWIYDTTPSSYNRVVQRGSDGLGMTGGRRILGARSAQASNRRAAAFR